MIQIVPSISISNGKCAKLSAGTFENARLYDQSPLDLAQYFENHGITRLHFVDLDGAREHTVVNYHILQLISGYTDLNINFSGGIRTDGSVQLALEHGAKTVTIATVAATDPEKFLSWLISFGPDKLVLGADIREGKIALGGWQSTTQIDAFEHIRYFYERGIKFLKCTDVLRDGNMEGPNFELYKKVVEEFPDLHIVASGGVRSVEDIDELEQIGVWGVVIARAFYEDRLQMSDIEKYLVRA